MRTRYYTASSLVGFIATGDDFLEWLFPLGDINDTAYPAFIARVGALAMGAATYEWILRSVTLGKGKPEFPRRVTSPPWKLLSVRQIGSGFAELRCRLPNGRQA